MALAIPAHLGRSLPTTIPHSQLASILSALDGEEARGAKRTYRARASEELRALDRQSNAYGNLVESFTIMVGGEPVAIPCINPHAFLHGVSHAAPAFGDMVRRSLRHGVGRLALYADEIKPGNTLRPDLARSLQCVDGGIAEWPDWYRSRGQGWLPFAVILAEKVKQVEG